MRVGIIAPEFPPDFGGVETYAYEVASELGRRGNEVCVFTRADAEQVDVPRFKVIPTLRHQYRNDWLSLSSYSMDVWHVMNAGYAWVALESHPVIVSVHGNDFISPYQLPRCVSLPSIPGVWRIHPWLNPLQSRLDLRVARRLMKRGLERARQVITNSEYTKTLLLERLPRCVSNTSVGLVGVSDEFLSMAPKSGNDQLFFKLITVCRLAEPRKNVDIVLQALAQLREFSFHYTIVGDGDLKPKLQSLSRQLAIEDRVEFTGSIPKSNLPQMLASSDLFVMTSSTLPDNVEGFGIVYLEANACGTPVLAARTAGAREAVQEGKTGYFVDGVTVSTVASALRRFFMGEILFRSEDCQTFARQFTWARVVDRAGQYYSS